MSQRYSTMRFWPVLLAAWLVIAGPSPARAAKLRLVTIGTGGQTGVYYEVGQSLCRMLNRDAAREGMRCTAPATAGSVANLNALRAGQMTFGLVQADVQYAARHGEVPFDRTGPLDQLRAVFSLYPEAVTIVARDAAGIAGVAGLAGKRVSIGNAGSSQRATVTAVLAALGLDPAALELVADLKPAEQAGALCAGKVDAMVYTVGHPNAAVTEAAAGCAVHVLPIEGAAIARLIQEHPYFLSATVPGGLYRGTPEPVPTIGVLATLVTAANVPDDTVYLLVKTVFEHFDQFRRLNPALATLDPKAMVQDGLTAPLHDGALRYYRERGWR